MNFRKSSSVSKTELFEEIPVYQAVLQLSIPSVISSLVMVIYNLSDTYFVGLLNNPIETAAVTLVSPVTLGFNAVNNLFGVGCSSMISRALGRKQEDFASRISSFGFYGALCSGLMFSLLCLLFQQPLLGLLGANDTTWAATEAYLYWTVALGRCPVDSKCCTGLYGTFRGSLSPRQHRNHERMYSQHHSGSYFHPSPGTEHGRLRSWTCHIFIQLCGLHLLFYSPV